MPESPAAKAGIVRNDVITAVNDLVVDTPEELRAAVRKAGAGKEAMVKFLHGNEAKEAKVKLDESSLSFGRMGDIQERFPKMFEQLKGELPPGLSPELRQQIEELHQRFRDMQEKAK
jgi:predicted metalloprotease with PDZ domain